MCLCGLPWYSNKFTRGALLVRESTSLLYCVLCSLTCRVGLTQMVTVEIKIPNRLVGLGKFTRHYYVAVMAYVYVLK